MARWTAEIFVDIIRGIHWCFLSLSSSGNSKLLQIIYRPRNAYQWLCCWYHCPFLNASAYIAEIVRGGIKLYPSDRWSQPKLGISYGKTMRKIILPQATKIMLPNFEPIRHCLERYNYRFCDWAYWTIQTGEIIIARSFQSFKMYAILAVFYQ